jgi:hypothetical protein
MHPVEKYLRTLRSNRSAGVAETSNYGALAELLDAAGAQLRPRVRCVLHPTDQGAGIPDAGLFSSDQFARGRDEKIADVLPQRGAVEAKPISEDARQIARSAQVAKYVSRYGQVLVTTFRDWVLVERGPAGEVVPTERFRMAESEAEFWTEASDPRAMAAEVGDRLIEFLHRVMIRPIPLVDPKDVAWLLAAYARDARFRVERRGNLPALAAVRGALEEALGVSFEGERGEHFFRSTLVQTLFYGVFSAWTLWAREGTSDRFDWRTAVWHLRVPVIGALFGQVAVPARLGPLNLIEVLDWAGAALNQVDRSAFFARFGQDQAVQYFYEPFLQAFDPELRKDLGVWYTPPEVVKFMVGRVDAVLRADLGITDGLADKRVLVLDPCCGTGAFLVEVLERIAQTLRDNGEDALLGLEVQRAAAERVLGFEIMPAPFVVAHLQLGLLLNRMGLQPSDEDRRRVGVFLTNALTGWDPADEQKVMALPELAAERDAADHVKRDPRVLVVIGNPPYNGYPGLAMGEERGLVEAYRSTVSAPKPQGQGLNDLYVRFFRMAERRIVEMTGRGIVCFISNHSWLDGLSFSGMRERYLDVFDRIWIDSLNGDKYRTGKLTPDGDPDPSIFSTEWNREGIQVGTAVALLARTEPHQEVTDLRYREFWGAQKRAQLVTASDDDQQYLSVHPVVELGLPFRPRTMGADYLQWPNLPSIWPTFYPGVVTSRDSVVVDTDRQRLVDRMRWYFDPCVSNDEVMTKAPKFMKSTGRFSAEKTRDFLKARGIREEGVVRYAYRPLDTRWIYWESATKLLDEKRSEFFSAVLPGNLFLVSQSKARRDWSSPTVTGSLGDYVLLDPATAYFPLYLPIPHGVNAQLDTFGSEGPRPNLSGSAVRYLSHADVDVTTLFFHTLAMLHSPAYRIENSGALRQDWPRVPLPANRSQILSSGALGKALCSLLDPEQAVSGVTSGIIRQELRVLGGVTHYAGAALNERDFTLAAGWGRLEKSGAVMPGRGRAEKRPWRTEERAVVESGALELELEPAEAVALLGETVVDVYLNDQAFWRCVPVNVWDFTLGGYPVIKKWLSYREQDVLGRALTLEEVREVTGMVRRIAAILLMGPALNAAYLAATTSSYAWVEDGPAAPESSTLSLF